MWDVAINDEAEARTTYDRFNELFKTRLIAITEEVLSRHSTPHYHIRMEELEVDLGDFDDDFTEVELIERFEKALERALTAKLFAHPQYRNVPLFEKQSKIESDLSVFQYFIQHGSLPSYRNSADISLQQIVEEQLLAQPKAIIQTLRATNSIGTLRFVEQFSTDTTERLLRVLTPHYYLTILQQLQLFERLYRKLLPNHISLKALLYKGALSYLIENEGGVFDLKAFQKSIVLTIEETFPIPVNSLSQEVQFTVIQHYLVHGWLPDSLAQNINSLVDNVLKKAPQQFQQLLQPLQSYPQVQQHIQQLLTVNTQKALQNLQDDSENKVITFQNFLKTGQLPKWAKTNLERFENWLIQHIRQDEVRLQQVLKQLEKQPAFSSITAQLTTIFQPTNNEDTVTFQAFLKTGKLPKWTKTNLERFENWLVQHITHQNEVNVQQVLKLLNNEPLFNPIVNKIIAISKPIHHQTTPTAPISREEEIPILNRFFKTGQLPIWAVNDVIIFEKWLVQLIQKDKAVLKNYATNVVTQRIVSLFTIDHLQTILSILSPTIYTTINKIWKTQRQQSNWSSETELLLFLLEKGFTFALDGKDEPNDIKILQNTVYQDLALPTQEIDNTVIIKQFFENKTIPDWSTTDSLVFEAWFIKTLKAEKTSVLQQLKQYKPQHVAALITTTFSLEGTFSIVQILHQQALELVKNYIKTYQLSLETKQHLVQETIYFLLEKSVVEVIEIEHFIIKTITKYTKKQPSVTKATPNITHTLRREQDTFAYFLTNGKAPFWWNSTTQQIDELLLTLLEKDTDAVRVILRTVNTSPDTLSNYIIHLFSDVAIGQLLNSLHPNYYGFINTTILAIEKIQQHSDFPTVSNPSILKWKGVLKYALSTTTFNINQFILFVLQEIAVYTKVSKNTLFNWTITTLEMAIQKGENRFSPLKNILFSQQRNLKNTIVIDHVVSPQSSKNLNATFLKMLSNKGIPTISNTQIDEKILEQYAPLVHQTALEYFFVHGTFPLTILHEFSSIDKLIDILIEKSSVNTVHIFKKYHKKDALLQVLWQTLTTQSQHRLIQLFFPNKQSEVIKLQQTLLPIFSDQTIDSQTIALSTVQLQLFKYPLLITESKFTSQHYIQQFLKTISRVHRIAYKTLLEYLTTNLETIPSTEPLKIIAQALKNKLPKRYKPVRVPTSSSPYTTWRTPKPEQILYVKNAGMILVYPLLDFYFKSLEMTTPLKKFKSPEHATRAVHLLQYIATKQEKTPEHELSLNKILCEVPFGQPIVSGIELTDNEKAWSEELLKVVVKQWKAVKNTTPDGLRNSFLIRDGRLEKKDANWVLRVEQKPYDMLLGKLPWGLSTIKLPWMKEALYVEWR